MSFILIGKWNRMLPKLLKASVFFNFTRQEYVQNIKFLLFKMACQKVTQKNICIRLLLFKIKVLFMFSKSTKLVRPQALLELSPDIADTGESGSFTYVTEICLDNGHSFTSLTVQKITYVFFFV